MSLRSAINRPRQVKCYAPCVLRERSPRSTQLVVVVRCCSNLSPGSRIFTQEGSAARRPCLTQRTTVPAQTCRPAAAGGSELSLRSTVTTCQISWSVSNLPHAGIPVLRIPCLSIQKSCLSLYSDGCTLNLVAVG